MNVIEVSNRILEDLRDIVNQVDESQAEALMKEIRQADKIFVAAAGRSFLMMKAFAMRLMHMGLKVYVVGETVTPAIGPEDLLIVGSGSGGTATIKVMAEKAKKIGARMALLTIYEESAMAQMADTLLIVPAATNQVAAGKSSWQPGGSSFEQSLLILLDAVVFVLSEELSLGLTKGLSLHANLE